MTLFDVMHTGSPIGLQVRTRVPSYQPAPELPVTKKLAKLFGRPDKADAKGPPSAADELAQLRRELAEKTAPTIEESRAVEPLGLTESEPQDPTDKPAPIVRSAPPTSFRAREIAEAFSATEDAEPHSPQAPRRSFRDVLRDRWAIASPKLESMTVRLRSIGGRGMNHAATHAATLRELYSRYAVTAFAATGVVVLLCGSFYAGKLLFRRPAVALIVDGSSALADPQVRPDALEVANGGSARSNEALGNVSDGATEAKLEHVADPTPAKAGAFGGRRSDLNYVIVQSYFSQAEADATVDVLNKYGLKTSVEINLPRWAMAGKTLFSVVSVDGFAKMTGNPDYQTFMTSVGKVSEKEAGTALPKKLDPRPYRLQPQS